MQGSYLESGVSEESTKAQKPECFLNGNNNAAEWISIFEILKKV